VAGDANDDFDAASQHIAVLHMCHQKNRNRLQN
jgi:hypothetical protein